MEPIRLMIVDDHVVVRRGLRSMLAGTEDVEIVGEAGNAGEAIELVTLVDPDIILLDIRMPGMDGLRLLRVLSDRLPRVKVIILTNYDEEQLLLEAFRVGAHGYLLKNVGRDALLEALRTVHSGRRMLSPEVMDRILRQFTELNQQQTLEEFGLSVREVELLSYVADGNTNRQIAEKMFWSERTVKRKLSDVFRKLDATDRAHAVAVAMRHGLL
jgi:DNA-binding NarL/FixJ family response regulator